MAEPTLDVFRSLRSQTQGSSWQGWWLWVGLWAWDVASSLGRLQVVGGQRRRMGWSLLMSVVAPPPEGHSVGRVMHRSAQSRWGDGAARL